MQPSDFVYKLADVTGLRVKNNLQKMVSNVVFKKNENNYAVSLKFVRQFQGVLLFTYLGSSLLIW